MTYLIPAAAYAIIGLLAWLACLSMARSIGDFPAQWRKYNG